MNMKNEGNPLKVESESKTTQDKIFRSFIEIAPKVGLGNPEAVFLEKENPYSTLQLHTMLSDGTPILFNVGVSSEAVFSIVEAPNGVYNQEYVFDGIDKELKDIGMDTSVVYKIGDKLYVVGENKVEAPVFPDEPRGPRSAAIEAERPWYHDLVKGTKITSEGVEYIFSEKTNSKYVLYNTSEQKLLEVSIADFEEQCKSGVFEFVEFPEDISSLIKKEAGVHFESDNLADDRILNRE